MAIREGSLCAKTSVEMIYLLYSSPQNIPNFVILLPSSRQADELLQIFSENNLQGFPGQQ